MFKYVSSVCYPIPSIMIIVLKQNTSIKWLNKNTQNFWSNVKFIFFICLKANCYIFWNMIITSKYEYWNKQLYINALSFLFLHYIFFFGFVMMLTFDVFQVLMLDLNVFVFVYIHYNMYYMMVLIKITINTNKYIK